VGDARHRRAGRVVTKGRGVRDAAARNLVPRRGRGADVPGDAEVWGVLDAPVAAGADARERAAGDRVLRRGTGGGGRGVPAAFDPGGAVGGWGGGGGDDVHWGRVLAGVYREIAAVVPREARLAGRGRMGGGRQGRRSQSPAAARRQ